MVTDKKGITVKIDADLHAEIREYLNAHEMTMAEFISLAVEDELHPKYQEKEENTMEKMRTLAFQVPEDLFQRIKDYLRRNNMTQKEFVIGLIESEIDRDLTERETQNNAEKNEEELSEDEDYDNEIYENEKFLDTDGELTDNENGEILDDKEDNFTGSEGEFDEDENTERLDVEDENDEQADSVESENEKESDDFDEDFADDEDETNSFSMEMAM